MFNTVIRILLKIVEVIGCIACLITKNLTDQEARRVAVRNQKYSREWSLLNNVTWSREGNAFASVTYGGFTLITSLLLISRCINARSKPSLTEKIFLVVGMIFFFIIGSLVYASIEQVPSDLYDNAIILGTLSYFVAILFLIDLAEPMSRKISHYTQTDNDGYNQTAVQTQASSMHLNLNSLPVDLSPTPSSEVATVPHNGYYFTGNKVDIVQTKILPSPQQPVFAKILLPEKKRPFKEKHVTPTRLMESKSSGIFLPDKLIHRPGNRTHNLKQYQQHYEENAINDDEVIDRPIYSGFVAQAARMWDRKAKRTAPAQELSTIV